MTQSGLKRTSTNLDRSFGSKLYDGTRSLIRMNSTGFSATGKIKNFNR